MAPPSNAPEPPSVPQKAHSPAERPTPHFDDPPKQEDALPESHEAEDAEDADANDDDDDEVAYPEPSSEQTLLPPPNFKPFFHLIEDTTTGEYHHPHVHYVFADDDPVIITAAAMRSLGLDDTKYLPQNASSGEEKDPHNDLRESAEHGDDQDEPPVVESPLPPPIPGVREHYLLVDVAADGHTVLDAHSMSPHWQITNATVRTAPSFDEDAPDPGYMLKLDGVEIPGKAKGKAKGEPGENKLKAARERSEGDIFAALDGLVRGVEDGLVVAGRISGAGEEPGKDEGTEVAGEGHGEGREDREEKGKRRGSDVGY